MSDYKRHLALILVLTAPVLASLLPVCAGKRMTYHDALASPSFQVPAILFVADPLRSAMQEAPVDLRTSHSFPFPIPSPRHPSISGLGQMTSPPLIEQPHLLLQTLDLPTLLVLYLLCLEDQPCPVADLVGEEGERERLEEGAAVRFVEICVWVWWLRGRRRWRGLVVGRGGMKGPAGCWHAS